MQLPMEACSPAGSLEQERSVGHWSLCFSQLHKPGGGKQQERGWSRHTGATAQARRVAAFAQLLLRQHKQGSSKQAWARFSSAELN